MSELLDILCCGSGGGANEEKHLSPEPRCSLIAVEHTADRYGQSAQDISLEKEQIYTCQWIALAPLPLPLSVTDNHLYRHLGGRRGWNTGASLQAQFSVLNDWATALHANHLDNVVHGNLTPESACVINGKGVLRKPSQGWAPDDDVGGARWAAPELFHVDNDDTNPTKMSDVYSFGCIMLQMLTGKVPYCGTTMSEQVVYLKYLGREPIDAQTPRIVDRQVAFMRRCWSAEPEKRPSMGTVVDFIREEIKRLGGSNATSVSWII